jgi:excisionase family DNA binding protein
MDKLLVSITDAAKALSLGRTSIYDLIRSGELETRKMGRRRLITAKSLRRLADDQG